jgi:hypothetical protein
MDKILESIKEFKEFEKPQSFSGKEIKLEHKYGEKDFRQILK